MLILGIESSTLQVGCAIGGHEGVIALFEMVRGKRHVETLAPAIQFICQQSGLPLDEISAVAVDIGPGLFTGLRVGIATAKAVSHALRVPMIGVSSLDLLAFPLRHSPRLIVAVIDARRGEVFSALYRCVPGGLQRDNEPRAGTPEELVSDLVARNEDVLLVGDGAIRYADHFRDLRGVQMAEKWLSHPSAAPLVQLAHAQALREQWVNPWQLEPLYLRKPDAEINWSSREHR